MGERYADQRGHDVAWMTAAERAEYDARLAEVDRTVKAAAEVCSKCRHPVMRDWGGYGHAPGYRGKRHVVTV